MEMCSLAKVQRSDVLLCAFRLPLLLLDHPLLKLAVETFGKLFTVDSRHSFENFECIFELAFSEQPARTLRHYEDVEEVQQEGNGRDEAEDEPVFD